MRITATAARGRSIVGRVRRAGLLLGAAVLMAAAVPQAQAAVLTHVYDLNGTFTDSLGGPSLVSAGGTLNATNYSFGPNQGLSLSNTLANAANYSIELDFQLAGVAPDGYSRILDFKNRTSDNGLYDLNTAVDFFPISTGSVGAIPANTNLHLVLTRDSMSNQLTAYVGGVEQITSADPAGEAIFSGTNNIINFFIDDLVIPNETSAGSVDRIRIYDGALSAAEVAGLTTVPLPPAVWAGLGLLPIVAFQRRRAMML